MQRVALVRARTRAMSVVLTLVASVAFTAAARADGPGVGTPTVASLGDSYISGESGRWAGNTGNGQQYVDALGSTAYFDNASNTGEQIVRCHRSKSAEAFIGGGINGANFACSGARTSTFTDGDDNFKPGLDFYLSGSNQGQARMLQGYAATHNVKLVVVSIGGNNFNFADIVTSCVADFLYSPTWWKDYCKDDSSVTANFTSSNISAQTTAIKNALLNVKTAMVNAGYASTQYTILVQTYPSPIPRGSGFRYSESGYTRQSTGGCGFWNADADWANDYALPTINNAVKNAASQTGLTNVKVMDIQSAFNGRRLCESTVGRLEEKGVTYWSDSGAVDKIEWFQGIRTVTTSGTDYYIQESLHPDYLAQKALRNCVRQAYNAGTPKGGACARSGTGLNTKGEPNMLLQ
jgi:hypothetical protein